MFRSAVAELGRILIYEASQDFLPVIEGQVETPLGTAQCNYVDCEKPVKVTVSLIHLTHSSLRKLSWIEREVGLWSHLRTYSEYTSLAWESHAP